MTQDDAAMQQKARRRRRAAVLAAVLAAVAAVVIVLVVVAGDDEQRTAGGAPREVSVDELREFAASRERPVFWAGPIADTKLELTETSRGHVFVRYLPELAPIGDEKPLYATVATYPQSGAYQAARRSARRKGMVSRRTPRGGIAVWRRARPTSVYVAFPDSSYLVEIFHPDAEAARRLALSGRVQPVS